MNIHRDKEWNEGEDLNQAGHMHCRDAGMSERKYSKRANSECSKSKGVEEIKTRGTPEEPHDVGQ